MELLLICLGIVGFGFFTQFIIDLDIKRSRKLLDENGDQRPFLSESGCPGFQDLQDMNESGKGLLEAIRLEKERLAQSQHVPIDELRVLVFTSYSCGMVSEGRGCELLSVDTLDFRKQYHQWLDENPNISAIALLTAVYG